jgi:hypothetical protein
VHALCQGNNLTFAQPERSIGYGTNFLKFGAGDGSKNRHRKVRQFAREGLIAGVRLGEENK